MKKQSKVSALVLSLVLLSMSGLANAEFTKGMTNEQAAAEVDAQLKDGKSLADIAAAAKEAGVSATALTTALIAAGQAPVVVAKAVVAANPKEAAAITKAAVDAAPKQAAQIQAAVLTVPGVTPTTLSAPASERRQETRQEQRQQQRQEQRQESQPIGGGAERPKNTASPS